MAKNGGLIYLGIKNEHINVCPQCGSTDIRQYSRKYEVVKTGLAYYSKYRKQREFKFVCKNCNNGFNQLDNLQRFLEKKFDEAREIERSGGMRKFQ